jgi:hypothetical protein
MFKKWLVKRMSFGLVLSSLCLFYAQTQAAIITIFDSGVDVEISSTFSDNLFETVLFIVTFLWKVTQVAAIILAPSALVKMRLAQSVLQPMVK